MQSSVPWKLCSPKNFSSSYNSLHAMIPTCLFLLQVFTVLFNSLPVLLGDSRRQCCSSHWCALDQRQRGRKLLLLFWRLSQVCCLSKVEHANNPSQTHQVKCLRPEHLPGGFHPWFAVRTEHFSLSLKTWFSRLMKTVILLLLTAERRIYQQGEM